MITQQKTDEAASLLLSSLLETDKSLKWAISKDKELKEVIELLVRRTFFHTTNWAISEFLKVLWHPASEEPKSEKYFLYEYRRKEGGLGYNIGYMFGGEDWAMNKNIWRITRWLDINDLTKEGGE